MQSEQRPKGETQNHSKNQITEDNTLKPFRICNSEVEPIDIVRRRGPGNFQWVSIIEHKMLFVSTILPDDEIPVMLVLERDEGLPNKVSQIECN